MKNQSKKQVLKSIPKHARRFVKVYNSSIEMHVKLMHIYNIRIKKKSLEMH